MDSRIGHCKRTNRAILGDGTPVVAGDTVSCLEVTALGCRGRGKDDIQRVIAFIERGGSMGNRLHFTNGNHCMACYCVRAGVDYKEGHELLRIQHA